MTTVWTRLFSDGSVGGEFYSRADAQLPSLAPCQAVKATAVQWSGQPMRVKGGPEIRRVKDFAKYPGGTVYTVGRGRQKFDAKIMKVTPYEGKSLLRTLFKGALWPLDAKQKASKSTRAAGRAVTGSGA